MQYEQKVAHYLGQNLLAWSLHPGCYDHNPSFTRFRDRYQLPFKPYPERFTAEDMAERQELYRQLCERVWSPTEFGVGSEAVSSDVGQAGE